MEAQSPDGGKKVALEDLSHVELVKKCKSLLILAQKARQAKDQVQGENDDLKLQLQNKDTIEELVQRLTQEKLANVITIEEFKRQNVISTNKLEECLKALNDSNESNNHLDSENVSLRRQTQRLSDENEQLLIHLDSLEKQLEECKRLGLEQQSQLLQFEESNTELEARHVNNEAELQKMLSISLEEVKKLKSENAVLLGTIEDKEQNITVISKELQEKVQTLEKTQSSDELEMKLTELKKSEEVNAKLKEKLKMYHMKIVKLAGNVKSIKEDKNEILSLLKTHTNQVEVWKSQLNLASQRLCECVNMYSQENIKLQEENQILKDSNAKYLEQLKLHKTDDEKSEDMNELENVKTENSKLQAQLKVQEEQVNELKDEITRLMKLEEHYKSQNEVLTSEKKVLYCNLCDMEEKHQRELKEYSEQTREDNIEVQNKFEENERICIEYRKVISRLENEVEQTNHEAEKLKASSALIQKQLEHSRVIEKQIADKTSEEILKLVQENAQLLQLTKTLQEQRTLKDTSNQTENIERPELEEQVANLKRENSELLSEMNEMNQAIKDRGETISKFQSHCEEVMKKLQIYESQANKNVDNISQKEEIITKLEEEIQRLKQQNSTSGLYETNEEIVAMKTEIENLREKLNGNLETSYADSETMSTSTISRADEVNRMKELEGSWEERYGKLRNLAVKLKGKVRDVSSELLKEQNEKNDIQQKLTNHTKTIATIQAHSDNVEDELHACKVQLEEYIAKLNVMGLDSSRDKQKIADNEEVITSLRREIEALNQERTNTDIWKKQISGKVQTFRKELEMHKIQKKENEATIAKLTSELEAESVGHKHTKSSLEVSNSERIKNSVLNLEMQDYERSVKELSQKLEKKQDEITTLQGLIESNKTTINAVREQNKLLEERFEEGQNEMKGLQSDLGSSKKKIIELEDLSIQKDNKIQHQTELLQNTRSENEELSTELTKLIAEHQKINHILRNEKEHLRGQVLSLQQGLRDAQDELKLKSDELSVTSKDYETYKIRAQSVLRQSNTRDVGLEEKLAEELSGLKMNHQEVLFELNECRSKLEGFESDNGALSSANLEINTKYQEVLSEVEDLKSLYDQLTNKYQQTVIENSETVRNLKVHAETLVHCYRQQLSEQELRHNREILELQNKIEKVPSPNRSPLSSVPIMLREEGEGSESTESSSKRQHPVPLEKLLGEDSEQETAFIKKQLSEEESKVVHLTALLADTEQDLAKHAQMNKVLKEEIRRQQRSVEREKHAENLEYLKNVVFKFVTLNSGDERSRLVPVLNTILKLSPEETQKLTFVARGDSSRGWTNYIPLWQSPSKS